MARAGLNDHPKFHRFVRLIESIIPEDAVRMGIAEPLAWGYLESIWKTAYQLRRDLIGDRDDVEISAKYRGEPGRLAEAFVKAGFVEVHKDKYYVHDLQHHAPSYVKTKLKILSPPIDDRSHIDDSIDESIDDDQKNRSAIDETIDSGAQEEVREELKEEVRVKDSPNPLLIDQDAKHIAEAYQREITGNGSFPKAKAAIAKLLDEHPQYAKADLLRFMGNYRLRCERENVDRKFRWGAARFFSEEWTDYIDGDRVPPVRAGPTAEELERIVKAEREAAERRMS